MLIPHRSGSAAETREFDILRELRTAGNAPIAAIAGRFGISEMTVRRALQRLEAAGLVIRTPGGAMAAPVNSLERSFLERTEKMAPAKDAIGRTAAGLVNEGGTIVLDSGTTTRYIARYLAGRKGVTVVTNSLAVVDELAGSDGIRVQLTGGTYRRSSHDLVGSAVTDTLEDLHAQQAFFGAAALSFHKGIMNYDAEIPRAFLRAGKKRILVVDSSKIGVEAVYRYCPVMSCDLVITDGGVKPADLAQLRRLTDVLVAK